MQVSIDLFAHIVMITTAMKFWSSLLAFVMLALVAITILGGCNFPSITDGAFSSADVQQIPQLSHKTAVENIAKHVRQLSQAKSFRAANYLAGTSAASGFFFAEYYNGANCSHGTGSVSYVEGYATGLCLQVQSASGRPSGSMIQTCQNSGNYLLYSIC